MDDHILYILGILVLYGLAIGVGLAWWKADWRHWRVILIVVGVSAAVFAVFAPAVLLLHAFQGDDTESTLAQCAEPPTRRAAVIPSPRNKPQNIELETNRGRPTLTIALADQQSASDTITFQSKGRRTVLDIPSPKPPKGKTPKGKTPSERKKLGPSTGAIFLETPRRAPAEPTDSKLRAKAEPIAGGTAVRLKICIDRGELLKAGTYQGTVRIFGPRVNDFDYAVVITQKWPWEIALSVLWYAGLAFIAAAWLTDSLTFDPERKGPRRWFATVAGVAFAIFAMAPAFFGAYWNNATWGSDPGPNVIGLATAGFTAALAGLVTAQKFIKKDSGEEKTTKTETTSTTTPSQ